MHQTIHRVQNAVCPLPSRVGPGPLPSSPCSTRSPSYFQGLEVKLCSAGTSIAGGLHSNRDALFVLQELGGWNHWQKTLPFGWKRLHLSTLYLRHILSLPFDLWGKAGSVSRSYLRKDTERPGLRTRLSHLTTGGHRHLAPVDWLRSSWELILDNKSESFTGKKDKWHSGCFLT